MDFNKIIDSRSSVNSFSSKKPSWKPVMLAIDAALQGPFAGNRNNLKFIIVEDKNTIKSLAKHSNQSWISETKLAIVVISDDTILENLYGEKGRVYSRQQAGAAIQTVLFKLVDQKLSACWVGSYTDEIIKQLLKIPAHMQIEAIIPVGYAKHKQKKKRKVELSNSVNWEEYGMNRRPSLTEEHGIKELD